MQILSGLESDGFSGGDADLGSGARVATDAGFTRLDGEDAKSAEFDAVAFGECVLHGFEDGVDGGFGLGADEPGTLDDLLDEILFDQRGTFPASREAGGELGASRPRSRSTRV